MAKIKEAQMRLRAVILNATRTTVAEFVRTQELLRGELERIAEMTKDYPVVCTFAEYRFVFESRQDILQLIEQISQAISAYEQKAA